MSCEYIILQLCYDFSYCFKKLLACAILLKARFELD